MASDPAWKNWDFGPYGNKACNLCFKHLKCRMEHLIFRRDWGPPYCIQFRLSREIREELERRGLKQYIPDEPPPPPFREIPDRRPPKMRPRKRRSKSGPV